MNQIIEIKLREELVFNSLKIKSLSEAEIKSLIDWVFGLSIDELIQERRRTRTRKS